MAPPTPIGTFIPSHIPPVTGLKNSLSPYSNLFDSSGFFRSRVGSASKRKRVENSSLEAFYDLSSDYPPPTYPGSPEINAAKVKELLVQASSHRESLKKIIESKKCDPNIALIVKHSEAIYSLCEAIVENALIPLLGKVATVGTAPPTPPKPPAGVAELRAAIDKSECEAMVYDVNLGNVSTFNRSKLSAAFSAGLRSAVVVSSSAGGGGAVVGEAAAPGTSSGMGPAGAAAAEAVRQLDDAFGAAVDVDFMGQATKLFSNPNNEDDLRNGKFYSLPTRVRFTDKESRIYFENTLKKLGGPKTSQSWPKSIRTEMKCLAELVKERNPGKIVAIRVNSRSLAFTAWGKREGGDRWASLDVNVPIPQGVMLKDFKSDKAYYVDALNAAEDMGA